MSFMTEYSVEALGLRESSFYSQFPKKHCIRKVPTLRPFVLMAKKATWWWDEHGASV